VLEQTATGTDLDTTAEPPAPPRSRMRPVRKVAVAVGGVVLILAGVVMLVIPGPGLVAIAAGLGLLGTEFPAARRISLRLQAYARTAWHKVRPPKKTGTQA